MFKKFLLMLAIAVLLISSANAKTIIWVAMNQDGDGDGNFLNDFQEFTDGLKAEGYTVDIRLGYWDALTTAKAAELNAADLVLFSRSIQSGTFATDAAEIALWNSIKSPMLLASPYMLRKGRWNWVLDDTTIPNAAGDQGCPLMNVLTPAHPIFYKVSLDTNNQLMFADPKLASGNCSFAPTNAVGNGTLIAKTIPTLVPTNPPATNPPFQVADWAWIVEWQKGVEFYPSSGTFAGSHRLFLSAGAHETAGNGNSRNKWSGYNLTNEGWKLYLNAVKYMLGELDPKRASSPTPKDEEQGVLIDSAVLSWTAGMYAEAQNGTHNVFFGTDKNSVTNATVANPLGVTVFNGLALGENSIALDTLQYGTTYYWRVDEVNNPASSGTNAGFIWRFTTEKGGYAIPAASIINVTSFGAVYPDEPDRQDPNSTCTGAGLDANDMHSTGMKTMWLGMDEGAYLQYEFNNVYKLYDMLVWNYNEESPNNEYFGAKDVKVEYSLDGQNWTEVADVPEFAMATGTNKCVANTTVMLGGANAKFVKLTFLTGWGDLGLYGISEVRFSAEPTRAQNPVPAIAATNIAVNPVLSWKAGRYSVDHNVYISTDVNAVKGGTADMVTRSDANYAPALALAKTYYWRVDEVNNAEAYPVWDGSVWNFSTRQSLVVDNFEVGYDATEANFVWATWKDGVEVSANGGSEIGVGIDPPGLSTTNHAGGHAISVNFDNTGANSMSQVTAQSVKLPIKTTNWSIGSPSTLTIWFRGDISNVIGDSELYCTIGGKTDTYKGSITAVKLDRWYQWDINLTTLGANLSNISGVTIGIRTKTGGTTGGKGILYVDDILLSGLTPVVSASEILIEAEAYKTISEPLQMRDTMAGASGGKYIQVLEGTASSSNDPPTTGIATYEVTLAEGKYVIWCRVAIPVANQDAWWIRIQGATSDRALHTSGWDQWNALPAGTGWHWDDVHSSSPATTAFITWTMPAGKYTIEVAYRDSDAANPPKLDALLLVKTSN